MRFGLRSFTASALARALLAMAVALAGQAAAAAAARPGEGGGAPRTERAAGIHDLAGEWRAAAGAGGDRTVRLPSSWRDLGAAGGEITLWREVDWPPRFRGATSTEWGVLLGAARFGSYRLYADGELIGVHGDPPGATAGENAGATRPAGTSGAWPAPATRVFPIPRGITERAGPDSGRRLRLKLVFERAAWWRDRLAGSGGPVGGGILLGDLEALRVEERLDRWRDRRRSLPAILFGTLLLGLGAYHLVLYALRRQATEYLWFGAIAIGCGIGTWVVDGLAGYELALSEGGRRRMLAVLGHVAQVLLAELIRRRMAGARHRWVRPYQVSHVALAALMVVVPLSWIGATELPRVLWGLPAVVAILGLLSRRAWRRRADERVVWLAVVIVPVGLLLEIVPALRGAEIHWPWAGSSFLVVAVAMAVSVSDRFTATHRQLDGFRHRLEAMVDDRTEELAATHRKLQSEVAERKVMEEALHMLERAVEQSIDGIAVTDLAGSTQFLNEAWAKLHGYEATEVLGYDLSLFHSPEQMQQEVFPLMARVRETGAFQGEVWHRSKDGETFPTWMSVTRVQDADGEPVGMVAIARDLSASRERARERLRLESRVLQAEKLESLAKLSAGIAHDFNNLLTVILGNTSLVLSAVGNDASARARIHGIESAAERAAGLSDRLLASAGADRKLHLKPVDLNELLEGLRPDLAGQAPPGVELDFHLNAGLPAIGADPLQLQQVVRNLVANAFESIADERGVVSIRTSRVDAGREYFEGTVVDEGQAAGEYALFEVTDSGSGIDEQTRARLFDPFFSTKPGDGRGLGLATALGIVRAHRGAIKIYSQVGRGTTVEVLLPATTRPSQDPRAEADDLSRWRGEGLVLVVDDELLVREVSKDILGYYGFEVVTAADGREAVDAFRSHLGKVRAVVLDQTMPRMGGVEAFREIRELDPRAVVLLMSGYPDTLSRQLFDEGLAGFVHKPFRPADLVAQLKEVLED